MSPRRLLLCLGLTCVAGLAAIPIAGDPAVFELSLATRGEEEQTAAHAASLSSVFAAALLDRHTERRPRRAPQEPLRVPVHR